MKKRIVVFVSLFVVGCFGCKDVYAKTFQEKIDFQNYFYIYNGFSGTYPFFNTFFDEKGKAYFSVTPHVAFMPKQNYTEVDSSYSKEEIFEYSKILYYGYGYQGDVSLSSYYATQYLLFEHAMEEGYTIQVVDASKLEEDPCLDKAIFRLRERMKKQAFSLQDTVLKEKTYVISDPYILEHFSVAGDQVKVSKQEDRLEIILLEGSSFVLHFYPNVSCEQIKVWKDSRGTTLFGENQFCEKEYSITLRYEPIIEENLKEDPVITETSEEKKEETSEVRTFAVPSTDRYTISWLFILLFLGNIYYGFKK